MELDVAEYLVEVLSEGSTIDTVALDGAHQDDLQDISSSRRRSVSHVEFRKNPFLVLVNPKSNRKKIRVSRLGFIDLKDLLSGEDRRRNIKFQSFRMVSSPFWTISPGTVWQVFPGAGGQTWVATMARTLWAWTRPELPR